MTGSPFAFDGKCSRIVVNWQADRDNGSRAECPRRIRPGKSIVSWGKFLSREEGGQYAEVHCDSTIAWPLLVRAILEERAQK